ncbi:MAG: putative DNA binding domain-containing protein [Christensenellaceae bacterium]|jgi:ATP-dependent DNA helicase RecG|nr:putative DNA binding domain-containing protein [Christensenellaceae bacterium]
MERLNQLLKSERGEYELIKSIDIDTPIHWLKTVSAFANGTGGSIYFGVDDEHSKLTGIEYQSSIINLMRDLISTHIKPAFLSYDIEPINIDGAVIVLLKIYSGMDTQYLYYDDKTQTPFYRLRGCSTPVTKNVLNELKLKWDPKSHETQSFGIKFSDCNFKLFESTYKDRTGIDIDPEKDYELFGMSRDGDITFLGALFADDDLVKQSRIICKRYSGNNNTYTLSTQEKYKCEGNIIKLFKAGMYFLKIYTTVCNYIVNDKDVKFFDFERVALEESLVNALVHRDYSNVENEIRIYSYYNRFEFISPGGMVAGKSIKTTPINSIESARRNPLLCDLMTRMGFMKNRGSGLLEIHNASTDENRPIFNSTRQEFIVKLKALHYYVDLHRRGHCCSISTGRSNIFDD